MEIRIPVHVLGPPFMRRNCIVHDGRVGMVKAVEHVLGHHARRRVLYLHGIPTNADAVSRLNVCREVMSRYSLTLADSAIGLGNFTLVDGYRAARTKFEQDSSFDAIIAANDGMALGALDALRELGIVPGSNVSVTGFDDMTDARFSDPPLTTVSQPLHQMARAAIDLIAAQWLDKPLPTVNTIESDFVVRNSCGCGQYEIDLQSESILAKDASLTSFFAATSERLAASIAPRLGYSPDASLSQARLLVRAVELELTTEPGALLRQVNLMANELLKREIPGEGIVQAVIALSASLPSTPGQVLEKLWPTLQASVLSSSVRYQLEQRLRVEAMYGSLITVGHRILTALDREALVNALRVSLQEVGCAAAYLGLFGVQNSKEIGTLLYIAPNESEAPLPGSTTEAMRLCPNDLCEHAQENTIIVLPIAAEAKLLGLFAMERHSGMFDYQLLRDHVETSLRVIILHDEVLHQATLTERSIQERLATSERLRSLSLLAGGVAHDLNNALGSLVALSDVVMKDLADLRHKPDLDPGYMIEDLDVIRVGALRAAETIKDLMVLGQREQSPRRVLDVRHLVWSAVEDIRLQMTQACFERVIVKIPHSIDGLAIAASEPHVVRAIENLLRNAIEASTDNENVSVAVESRIIQASQHFYETIPLGDYVVIAVSDKGPGIEPEQLPYIFEPFFTTKPARDQSARGLGLAIAHGVAKDYGGYLDVHSELGVGTVFELYFPHCPAVQLGSSHPPVIAASRARVLVVDDDPTQLRTARRVLERLGYDVTTLSSGCAAVELVTGAVHSQDTTSAVLPNSSVEQRRSFEVIVFDVALNEDKTGVEYLAEIRQSLSHQPAIITSGHGLLASERVTPEKRTVWLPKPYTANALGTAVQSLLAAKRPEGKC